MKNVDFQKLITCFHEAAHLVAIQYYSYAVKYVVINTDSTTSEESFNWKGNCQSKNGANILPYHQAVISYAGFYIENILRGASIDEYQFSSDYKHFENYDLSKLDHDCAVILEDSIEALCYITLTLYKQERIFMSAHNHYDEEFMNWDF